MLASSSAPIMTSHIFMQRVTFMSQVEGPFLVPKVARNLALIYCKLASEKKGFLLVFCVLQRIRGPWRPPGRRHSPSGGIQWLLVKLGMCSIGRCTPNCTAASRSSKWPVICLHFLSSLISFLATTTKDKT